MSHGVHTAVNAVQPPASGALRNGAAAKPEIRKLAERHNPVLPPGQRGEAPIERVLGRFVRHNRTK
jgi:hypothetical protein